VREPNFQEGKKQLIQFQISTAFPLILMQSSGTNQTAMQHKNNSTTHKYYCSLKFKGKQATIDQQ
jgi:hypothetical protein